MVILGYTRDHMDEDMMQFLAETNLEVLSYYAPKSGMGMEFKLIGKYETPELIHLEEPVAFVTETFGGGKV